MARRAVPSVDWDSVRTIARLRKEAGRENVDLALEEARSEVLRNGSFSESLHDWLSERSDWGPPRLPHWR